MSLSETPATHNITNNNTAALPTSSMSSRGEVIIYKAAVVEKPMDRCCRHLKAGVNRCADWTAERVPIYIIHVKRCVVCVCVCLCVCLCVCVCVNTIENTKPKSNGCFSPAEINEQHNVRDHTTRLAHSPGLSVEPSAKVSPTMLDKVFRRSKVKTKGRIHGLPCHNGLQRTGRAGMPHVQGHYQDRQRQVPGKARSIYSFF